LRYFREALSHIAAKPGVMFQTGEEIRDWYCAATAI
jgi:allantoinase